MSVFNHTRPDHRPTIQRKPKPTPSITSHPQARNNFDSQVAMLKRLATPQRQALIGQIGRTHGNRHVQRLIQTLRTPNKAKPQAASLTVNAPNDVYEQEADRVADDVMNHKTVAGDSPPAGNHPTAIQTASDQPNPVTTGVERNINQLRGGGTALPSPERSFFENRMGHDFSQVRVHTGSTAVQTSRDLNARAFTVGSDIAFNQNEFRPGTDSGRHLIAHELTHVVQQGQATPRVQKADAGTDWRKRGQTVESDGALTERVDAGHGWSRAHRLNWDKQFKFIKQDSTIRSAFDEALPDQITMIFGESLTVDEIRAQIDQAVADGKPDVANDLETKLFQANEYAVVEALNVSESSRYKKGGGDTYCNIYAFDVVSAMGGYLPRSWWTDDSIKKIKNGESVEIKFALNNSDTVREMNANQLTDWMKTYGAGFGWRKATDVGKAQEAANGGKIAILLAGRDKAEDSGHVNVILPETEQHKAKYDAAGNFDMPLQSQAGRTNFKYKSNHYSTPWWEGNAYRDGAAWIYEGKSSSSFLTPEELGGGNHGGGEQPGEQSTPSTSLFETLSNPYMAVRDNTRTPRPGDYEQPSAPTQKTAVRSTATPNVANMNPALKGIIRGQGVLKNGDEGDAVTFIQQGLIDLGFSVGSEGADGDFGGNTEKAVKAFQKAYGLSVTGQVDKRTVLVAMTAGVSGRVSKPAIASPLLGGTPTTAPSTTTGSSNAYQDNPDGYHNVANQITSVMEGGSYSSLSLLNDGGIISYGKHQATLSSGNLENVLEAYLASAKGSNASTLQSYMPRVRKKEASLKSETAFINALKAAGKESSMKTAQNTVFYNRFWIPAVNKAQGGGIQSPLGYALLYDTNIQGGMASVMGRAKQVCGGNIGDKVNGKTITEAEFLLAYVNEREKRLLELAVAKEAKGEQSKADALRTSVYRCKAFRGLIEAGNLNLSGPDGKVTMSGPGKGTYTITGFDGASGGAPVSSSNKAPLPVSSEATSESPETLSDLEAAAQSEMLQKVLAGDKVLRIGSSGDAVEFIQKGLRWLGYDIGPAGADGDFGGNTDSAVRAFQGDHGLGIDGDVGKNTLTKGLQVLFGYQPSPQTEQEATAETDTHSDDPVDIPDVDDSREAGDLIAIGKKLLGDERYTKGHAYIGFTGKVTGTKYKPGDKLIASDAIARYNNAKPTWCNTFARDLVQHFLGEDPFGGRDLTSTAMYDFMVKHTELFTQLSSINAAWSEINSGEIVYFCAPGHISTGVPTPKSKMQTRTYNGTTYHFGQVIQAGKTNAHMNLSDAWTLEDFSSIKVFKYKPQKQ